VAFVILGYIGTQAPSPLLTTIAQVCTAVYFAFFLLMPFYSVIDRTKPVPERVTG
jgi:ubiquinol-cytochrome c reductase cytochrome b subunit